MFDHLVYIYICLLFLSIVLKCLGIFKEIHFVEKVIMRHFFPLLKILMDHQNLSEHVLCMVLYLIELGLENSADEESDEEVNNSLYFKY